MDGVQSSEGWKKFCWRGGWVPAAHLVAKFLIPRSMETMSKMQCLVPYHDTILSAVDSTNANIKRITASNDATAHPWQTQEC